LRLLLLGPDGQVGWELRRALAPVAEVIAAGRAGRDAVAGDLEQIEALRGTVRAVRPDLIVNAAAYTGVDAAEDEPGRARLVNATAPGALAEEAARLGIWLVHYSTDYVFDGSGTTFREEDAATGPLNVYGQTKLEGEQLIRDSGCNHLVLRTSWVYANRGRNFLRTMLRLAAERDRLAVVDDQHGAPTGAALIGDVTAHAIRALLRDRELGGTYHLAASGVTSWHGYARHAIQLARAAGHAVRVADDAITACPAAEFPLPARRPHNSRLSTRKLRDAFGLTLPPWQEGVARAVQELCTR
jgi:dTDP-4-dehydrorhamnose reductase